MTQFQNNLRELLIGSCDGNKIKLARYIGKNRNTVTRYFNGQLNPDRTTMILVAVLLQHQNAARGMVDATRLAFDLHRANAITNKPDTPGTPLTQ